MSKKLTTNAGCPVADNQIEKTRIISRNPVRYSGS